MGCASSNAAEKGPSKPSAQQIKLENDERKGRVEVIKQYFTELTALHPFTTDKIATHSTEKSLWVIIDNRVHDCTQWQHGHPGGAKSIQQQGGKDATEVFHQLHGKTTKNNVASRTAPTYVGVVYSHVAVSSSAPHNIPEAFASAFEAPFVPTKAQVDLETSEAESRLKIVLEYLADITAAHPFTTDKIATHSTEKSLWVIIDNRVHDCTQWQHGHPGGAKSIQQQGGKDATEVFHQLHGKSTKDAVASRKAPTYVGVVYQGVRAGASSFADVPADFASAVEAPSTASATGTREPHQPAVAAKRAPAPQGHLDAYDFRPVKVGCVKRLTEDVVAVTLAFDDANYVLPILPGGHVSIEAPVPNADPAYRSYSPMSVSKGEATFVVRRYPGGKGSTYLHGRSVGDVVQVRGPIPPKYRLSEGATSTLVLLAGGTGAAPLFSIAREAARSRRVHLVLCFRTKDGALLVNESRDLATLIGGALTVSEVYSQEKPEAVAGMANTYSGRFNEATLRAILGTNAAAPADELVVCGPGPFNVAGETVGVALGFAKDRIAVMD